MATILKSDRPFVGNYSRLPHTLLADIYPGMYGGYALRRLSRAYTGPCIEVQRGSQAGPTQDIGFSGDGLDVAALETFAQGQVCGVRRFYDQSGNGRMIQNSVFASQGTITNSIGKVLTLLEQPSVRFGGAAAYSASALSGMLQSKSNTLFCAVAQADTSNPAKNLGIASISIGTNGVFEVFKSPSANGSIIGNARRNAANALTVINQANIKPLGTPQLVSFSADWFGGSAEFTGETPAALASSGIFSGSNDTAWIGKRFTDVANDTALVGYISEFSFFVNYDFDEARLNADIKGYYGL
jgi:hypothetical protein